MNNLNSYAISMKLAAIMMLGFVVLVSCEDLANKESICFTAGDLQKTLFSNNSQEEDILLKCFHFRESKKQSFQGFESEFTVNGYANLNEAKLEDLKNIIVVAVFSSEEVKDIGKMVSLIFRNKDDYLTYKNELLTSFDWVADSSHEKEFHFATINNVEYAMMFQKEKTEKSSIYTITVSPKIILELGGDLD